MNKKINLFKRNLVSMKVSFAREYNLDIYSKGNNIVINNVGSINVPIKLLYKILDPKNSNILEYIELTNYMVPDYYDIQICNGIVDSINNLLIKYVDKDKDCIISNSIINMDEDDNIIFIDCNIIELLIILKSLNDNYTLDDIDKYELSIIEIDNTGLIKNIFIDVLNRYIELDNYREMNLNDLFKLEGEISNDDI